MLGINFHYKYRKIQIIINNGVSTAKFFYMQMYIYIKKYPTYMTGK